MAATPNRSVLTLGGLPLVRHRRAPLRATFLARPNRFVAEVELPGGEVVHEA